MLWRDRLDLAVRQVLDRGRGLSGFLSRLSILGLTLAVAVLLAVLAVMNGFEREMRERILGVVPHISIQGFADLATWREVQTRVMALDGVVETALFHERDLLAVRGSRVDAATLLGIEPATWTRWQPWSSAVVERLEPGQVVLGTGLARRLGVGPGDPLRVVAPEGSLEAGTLPVTRVLAVVSLIDSGTELDEALMLADFEYTAGMLGEAVTATGVALQLEQLFDAPRRRWEFRQQLSRAFYVSDWSVRHGNLYAAIRLSRDLVTLLLLSIIAVAAFNVVSSLVLVVSDRRGFIAMLQTMGATQTDIVWIFLLQGAWIGVLGASMGVLLGWLLASALPTLAAAVEWLVGVQLLNTDVYPLDFLPVDTRAADALWLWSVSVVLCLLAAIVPARRAIRVPVATALASSQP